MYGSESSLTQGAGGSMHLFDPENGFMGSSAIVASHIPVAVGAAYANKLKKNGKRVAVFFGDGATEEGVFCESISLACLMQLPIIFVVEDNGLAVHTSSKDRKGYCYLDRILNQFLCKVLILTYTGNPYPIYLSLTNWLLEEKSMPVFVLTKYHRHLEHVGINTDYNESYRRNDSKLWPKHDPVANLRKVLVRTSEVDVLITESQIDLQVDFAIQKAKMELI
jgi:pyruvate dehydrogenase E1 component alpha subunit